MEILQSADHVAQFFEWQNVYRPIWTDGRELPKDAADNPRDALTRALRGGRTLRSGARTSPEESLKNGLQGR